MKQLLLLILLVTSFSLSACGGGGGSSSPTLPPSITPPAQSLIGTYMLSGFTVYYDNGNVVRSTDTGMSYSGSFVIKADNTMTQTIDVNGNKVYAVGTWSYNASTSILTLVTTNLGNVVTTAAVTFSGNVMTTNAKLPGYREYDYWTKVSDSVTTAKASAAPSNDQRNSKTGGIIGAYLNEIETK